MGGTPPNASAARRGPLPQEDERRRAAAVAVAVAAVVRRLLLPKDGLLEFRGRRRRLRGRLRGGGSPASRGHETDSLLQLIFRLWRSCYNGC